MPRPLSTDDHPAARAHPGEPEPSIPVKVGAITRTVRSDEIRFIASCENYTQVALAASEQLLVRRTMRQWVELLPGAQFARVHRGLLVNLDRIGRIERGDRMSTRLHFTGGAPPAFEVKRRHWPALRVKLDTWRLAAAGRLSRRLGKSIAVLPFASLSRDPADEIFGDGISEELLNVLAKLPGLRVAARTSSFYFKRRNVPVPEIARQLDVDFVVEGSVRRSGRRVRITVQLIGAADGFHLWSGNFDRELTDILAVQDEIAAVIARRLQLALGAAPRGAKRVHPEAHRLALEGRHYWSLRTGESFGRAGRAFERALTLDPDFAAAHAGLADLCVVRAMYRLADGAPSAADDVRRARTEAQRALQLDPTLAEPHAVLGFAAFHEGRFVEALRAFPRAFALNPNYATGHQFYAWTLCGAGHLHRALREYAKAIALDPLSFINLDRHASMLALAGKFPEALAMNERAAALRPDVFVGNLSERAPILLALGRRDEAVAAARQVRQTESNVPFRRTSDANAIFTLRQAGFAGEAADYAAEMLARLPEGNYLRGFVLAATGRFVEALLQTESTPAIMLPFLYWSALWEPARELPAFHALLARLGRTGEYHRARETRRAEPVSARASLR